jgi:hypothetical protein
MIAQPGIYLVNRHYNPDLPNINQLDISIQSNEKIDIRIKSISEVGWPDSGGI